MIKIMAIQGVNEIYLIEDLYADYCRRSWNLPMNLVQLGWTYEGRSYMTEAQIAILDDMQNGCRFHIAMNETGEPLGFVIFRKARHSVIIEGLHLADGQSDEIVPKLIKSTSFSKLFFKYEGLRKYLKFLDNVEELHRNEKFRLMSAGGVKNGIHFV